MLLVFQNIHDDPFIQQFGVLGVLADGMGGLKGGKEASRIAVGSSFSRPLSPHPFDHFDS